VCSESGLPDDLSWGSLGYIRWLDTAQDLFHSKATHPLDHTDFTPAHRRLTREGGRTTRWMHRFACPTLRTTEGGTRERLDAPVLPALSPDVNHARRGGPWAD